MTNRDPRINPKPGDVLTNSHVTRTVTYADLVVEYRTKTHTAAVTLERWRIWSRRATVDHTTEDVI
jgi:hypothetical protein